jgi:hypothetical protein
MRGRVFVFILSILCHLFLLISDIYFRDKFAPTGHAAEQL